MEDQNQKQKMPTIPKLGLPKMDAVVDQGGITSREEQEQYKLRGIQDGKVEELINHEKRAEEIQRKKIQTSLRDKNPDQATGQNPNENSDKKANDRQQAVSDDESVQERQD